MKNKAGPRIIEEPAFKDWNAVFGKNRPFKRQLTSMLLFFEIINTKNKGGKQSGLPDYLKTGLLKI